MSPRATPPLPHCRGRGPRRGSKVYSVYDRRWRLRARGRARISPDLRKHKTDTLKG